MTKNKQKQFTIYVKRDVLFEAKIKADSLSEALELANGMDIEDLWHTPGDIIDDARIITAVFE